MTLSLRRPGYDLDAALPQLSAADPELGRLIERAGPCTLRLASRQSPFAALVESIVYQQLHGKAAATIHGRLLAIFGEVHPTPEQLLLATDLQLRAAGLSGNKAAALRDLAQKTIDGTVPEMAAIRRLSDEEIIARLTAVRGIGPWTVEMMLIFRLGRPDVLPVSDYGVRKGFALTFGKLKYSDPVTAEDLPKPDILLRRGERWRPWRSVASWYLWRACDLAAADKAAAVERTSDGHAAGKSNAGKSTPGRSNAGKATAAKPVSASPSGRSAR